MPFSSYLIDPHLPEGEGHALLDVWPLLILLLQDVAGEQWRGRHHVVLLQHKKKNIFNCLRLIHDKRKKIIIGMEDISAVILQFVDADPDLDLTICFDDDPDPVADLTLKLDQLATIRVNNRNAANLLKHFRASPREYARSGNQQQIRPLLIMNFQKL
jgi:hypothetical protein